jgi:hypothetical protein
MTEKVALGQARVKAGDSSRKGCQGAAFFINPIYAAYNNYNDLTAFPDIRELGRDTLVASVSAPVLADPCTRGVMHLRRGMKVSALDEDEPRGPSGDKRDVESLSTQMCSNSNIVISGQSISTRGGNS